MTQNEKPTTFCYYRGKKFIGPLGIARAYLQWLSHFPLWSSTWMKKE